MLTQLIVISERQYRSIKAMESYNFILVFVSLCLCGHLRSAHAQTCQGPLYVYQEDCKAYFAAGYTSSGIYTIQPDYLPAFEVCN